MFSNVELELTDPTTASYEFQIKDRCGNPINVISYKLAWASTRGSFERTQKILGRIWSGLREIDSARRVVQNAFSYLKQRLY
jgi:hypothetical protein